MLTKTLMTFLTLAALAVTPAWADCDPDPALVRQIRLASTPYKRVQATSALADSLEQCFKAQQARDPASLAAIAAMQEERRQRKFRGDASALQPGECVTYDDGSQWCPSESWFNRLPPADHVATSTLTYRDWDGRRRHRTTTCRFTGPHMHCTTD